MTVSQQRTVPKRSSPFHYKQASVGARFLQDQFGWELAERFTDPAKEKEEVERNLGVGDISHLVKFSLQNPDIRQVISHLYHRGERETRGTELTDGPGPLKGVLCAVLCKDEALLIMGPSHKEPVYKLLGAYEPTHLNPIDVSSVLAGTYILGPRSRALLSKLTDLNVNAENFPNLTATHSAIRHVPSIVLRFDLGNVLGYQVYFERAYSEYIWDVVYGAGSELGIVPVGFSAMKLLGWSME